MLENDILMLINNAGQITPDGLLRQYANVKYKVLMDTDIFTLGTDAEDYKNYFKAQKELIGVLPNLVKAKFIDKNDGLLKMTPKGVDFIKNSIFNQVDFKDGVNTDLFFDKGSVIPKRLADHITQKLKFKFKTTKDTEDLYVYDANKGIYTPDAENMVKALVSEILQDREKKRCSDEVIFYIKTTTYADINALKLNQIAISNGIYDIETGTLTPYSPDQFITSKMPIKYDPNAKPTEILKFLSEVVQPEDQDKLQEFIGYCLYRDYIFHKAFLLIGDGSNGKSTFLKMLETFLGRDNISNVSLQDLDLNRFAIAGLKDKLANIYPDLTDKALYQTGRFKMITGNDNLNVDQKFKTWTSFTNYSKQIFSCNKVPEVVGDDSEAFFRRWELINFPNKFIGKTRDPKKLEKITTEVELSGLLNWAIIGLKRLMDQGEFSHSKTTDEIRDQYTRLSSPVQAFINAEVVQDNEAQQSKQDLYKAFIDYCKENNLPTISDVCFFKHLVQSYGSGIRTERITTDTGRKWVFKGIKHVKPDQEINDTLI